MANISGLLGTAGGYKGTGVDAPSEWVTEDRLNAADQQYQTTFGQQQGLLGAIQAQNGLGNQTSVYNQLQGVANGTGANPAQAQLANATGANVSNQAALMAGQRGSSANTGMMARQASQQGAATQQQSAGQAAQLQAQQSLGALGQMGGMANTMASNQIGQTNANTNAAQAHQSALLNQNANQNAIRSQLISGTAAQQGAIGGQSMNTAGAMMSSSGGGEGKAEGGYIEQPKPQYGMGGMIGSMLQMFGMAEGGEVPSESAYQGQSAFGHFLNSPDVQRVDPLPTPDMGQDAINAGGNQMNAQIKQGNSKKQGKQSDDLQLAEGGKVPAMVSPGEQYLPPEDAKKVAQGKADPLTSGERIPGKPKHPGNNYANDVVPKTLEEGGIVIPNSVMQSKHPHWAAKKFVEAHMAKHGKGLPKKPKGMK